MDPYKLNLEKMGITRPERIRWWFLVEEGKSMIDLIPSSSLKKMVRRYDKALETLKITYECRVVPFVDFKNWLITYRKKMMEKGYRILASEAWYEKMIKKNRRVEGIFFSKDGREIGSCIFAREGTEYAGLAFKVGNDIPEIGHETNGSSLGAMIDYYFIRHALNERIRKISGGLSQNAFGVMSSLGYLQAKSAWFQPALPNEDELVMLDWVEIITDKPMIFYGWYQQQLHMWVVNIPVEEARSRFHAGELSVRELHI